MQSQWGLVTGTGPGWGRVQPVFKLSVTKVTGHTGATDWIQAASELGWGRYLL